MTDNIFYQIALWLLPLVFAIVFHEIAHGWTAYAFGDPTAKEARRLSLNPLRHVDPFGTIVLPLVLAISGAPPFGWAKPVPVRPDRLRNPRFHGMLVSLAGPATNFLLASLTALLLATNIIHSEFLLRMLVLFVWVNLILGLFNLLPIPPLDGGHALEGLLPRRLVPQFRKLDRFGLLFLLVAIVVVPFLFKVNILATIILPPALALAKLLLGMTPGV